MIRVFPIKGVIKRHFIAARRIAQSSGCNNFRHGAVLTKGGKQISIGTNEPTFSRHAALNKRCAPLYASAHAEIVALRGLSKDTTAGTTLYVIRVSSDGEHFMLSAPCEMCMGAIKNAGVRRIIYSIDDDTAASLNVNVDDALSFRRALNERDEED